MSNLNPRVSIGRRLARMAVVSLLLFGAVQPVMACINPRPLPSVWIIFHSRTRVWIVIHRYFTSAVQPGQFCACAIPRLPCITSVNGVLVTDAAGNPFPGFGFRPNDAVSQQFAQFAPTIGMSPDPTAASTTPWDGFLSPIDQTIPPDQEVDLMYDVTVVDGTTFEMLADALTREGLFGNAEALAGGTLLTDHLFYVRPGEIGEGTKSMVTTSAKKAMQQATKKH